MSRSPSKVPKSKNYETSSDSEDEFPGPIDHVNNPNAPTRLPKRTTNTQLKKTSTLNHSSGSHGKVHKAKNYELSSDGKDEALAHIDRVKHTKSMIDNQSKGEHSMSHSHDKAHKKTTTTYPKKPSKLNDTSGSNGKVHKYKNNESSSDGKDKAPAPIGDKSNGEDSISHSHDKAPKRTTSTHLNKPSTPNTVSHSREESYHQAPPVAIHTACMGGNNNGSGTETTGGAIGRNYVYYRWGPDNRKIGNYVEQGNSYMGDMNIQSVPN